MPSENKEIHKVGGSFLEFLTVAVKRRWFLFWFVFSITFCATAYALLSPKWFESTTSVLAAERTDFLSAVSGISSLLKGFSSAKGLAALTGSSETDRYIAILQSTSVLDSMIKKYDLRKVYDLDDDYYYKTIEELESNTEIEIQDEGNLTITVFDNSPQRAADMANYYVELLNNINSELSISNARANRQFIEKRYFQNLRDIDSLEASMQIFQEKHGVIAVPEQLEQTVKTMADVYANLTQKEIEYDVIKRTYGESHPLAKNAKIQLEELQKKTKSVAEGGEGWQKEVNLLIPMNKAPDLANKYLKIYRNLEIQYKILEFITPLYEQSKVEEVRDTPSVIVLDTAVPAERKSKPRGSLYALIAFVISSMIGFVIIFINEGIERVKVSDREKYDLIANAIKSDLKRISFRKE